MKESIDKVYECTCDDTGKPDPRCRYPHAVITPVTHRWSGPYHDRLEYVDSAGRVLSIEEVTKHLNTAHSATGENWIAVEKAKADAYEDAALRVEKISEDYYHEHGSYDGSTNAWELHHRHMEYVEALDAAVEAIRKRKAEKCQVTQAISASDETTKERK